jgi:RimJ/RimL family protein N-acetyltransferase
MFMRTQRLFLRPAWPEDARELTAAIAHESVVRMLSRVPWPYREADARAYIEREKNPRLPSLLITLPSAGGRIVGGIGLHDEAGEAAVGYWVTPDAWGCGIASEALCGFVALARLCGHARLVGYHAADNPASGRVLLRGGFQPTGRTRTFPSLGRGHALCGPELVLALAGEDEGQQPNHPRPATPCLASPSFGVPNAA